MFGASRRCGRSVWALQKILLTQKDRVPLRFKEGFPGAVLPRSPRYKTNSFKLYPSTDFGDPR